MVSLKLKRTLDDYNDRIFLMSLLCNQSAIHYNRLKTIFHFPLIITSSVMSIINSSFSYEKDAKALRIINITNNMTTALLLAIINYLKINEKHQNFKSAYEKFHKLCSSIESRNISKDEITIEYVDSIIQNYDNICDNIDFDIPDYIKSRVKKEYATKKTLPVCINGIAKLDQYRSVSLKNMIYDEINSSKNVSIDVPLEPVVESSIVYKNISPRVLEVKHIKDLQEL